MKASFIFLSFLFGVSQARARGPLDALPQGPVRVSVSVDVNNKGSGIEVLSLLWQSTTSPMDQPTEPLLSTPEVVDRPELLYDERKAKRHLRGWLSYAFARFVKKQDV